MKKGFFAKLAAENIKKNGKTYIPYIVTCIVTVMVFYIVKSLSVNPGLGNIAGGGFTRSAMQMGTWVVALFAVIFLFYTNSFLVKRRKKEFGLFHILGMERKHLARVMFWETIYTMLISIGLGIGLGIALDKIMFLAVVRITGREVALGFFLSREAVAVTMALFGVIFLMIFVSGAGQVWKSDPIELLRAGNVGEKEPRSNWLLTVWGFLFLGGGYYIAFVTENPIASVLMFFVAVVLVIVGTYLLFTVGSPSLLKALRRNKRYYYRTRHFISVSGMLYRMKQNAVGLANICILSTMVLVMLSTVVSMMVGMEAMNNNRYPMDYMFYHTGGEENRETDREMLRRLQETSGVQADREMEYLFLGFQAVRMEGEYILRPDRVRSVEDDVNSLFFLSLDDYNRIMGEEKTLEDNEIMIYSNRQEYGYTSLKLFGREYTIVEKLKKFVGNGMYESLMSVTHYIVVPDMDTIREIYDRQKEVYGKYANEISWVYGFDTVSGQEQQQNFVEALKAEGFSLGHDNGDGFRAESREDGRNAFLEIIGGLFFVGIFLGVLFVMATVLIIYYKQISEGYDDKMRFEIMQKVGMSRSEVKAAIHSQVLTVFFLPLVAAGIHVAAAFPLISRLVALMGLYDRVLHGACTAVVFLVFSVMYVVIYAMTAKTYYKIVSR